MLVLNFTTCTVLQVALEGKNCIWHKEHRHNIRWMLSRVGFCRAVVPKRCSASFFIYFLHNPQLCRIMNDKQLLRQIKTTVQGRWYIFLLEGHFCNVCRLQCTIVLLTKRVFCCGDGENKSATLSTHLIAELVPKFPTCVLYLITNSKYCTDVLGRLYFLTWRATSGTLTNN